MPPDRRVLAVCAMGVEAWGVRRRARDVRVLQVGIGGAAQPGAAPVVISAGLCGGLLPDQNQARWSSPPRWWTSQGTTHVCDPAVVASLVRAAGYLRLPMTEGSIITTTHVVTGPTRGMWAARGHVAVDMESAALAAVAPRFGALRVILDTPRHELSPAWENPARAVRDPLNWKRRPGSASTPLATRSASAQS